MVKETLEAFLELEMEEHLGYPKHDPEGRGSGNSRNGATPFRFPLNTPVPPRAAWGGDPP